MATGIKKYNCIIIDDEPFARQLIKSYVDKIPMLTTVAMCQSPLELPNLFAKHEVDLLFMDIEMPEIDALNFIKNWPIAPKVIFITAHRKYAVEAFELDVIDYLLKPVSFERLLKSVNRFIGSVETKSGIQENNQTKETHIFVNENREMIKLNFAEINYVEAKGDYLKFVLSNKKAVLSKMTLTEVLTKLDLSLFVQIHRSFIINTDKMTAYTAERVKIEEEWLNIGRLYKENFRAVIERA